MDGQQRLTTLILLCCALIEELSLRENDALCLQDPTISWIKLEIEYISERLFDCVIGQLRSRGQTASFPRIVRFPADNRGFRPSEAEYRSVIATFLRDFANYYLQNNSVSAPMQIDENAEEHRFFQNYRYIRDQVELGIYRGDDMSESGHQSELEHNLIAHEDFQKAGFRTLFEKLDILSDQTEKKSRN